MPKESSVPSTAQMSSSHGMISHLPALRNLAVKCLKCKEILYTRDWKKNLKVCVRCGYHFKLTAQ